MNREKLARIVGIVKPHLVIIAYIIQILFIIMYSQPEVEPFVYVRF